MADASRPDLFWFEDPAFGRSTPPPVAAPAIKDAAVSITPAVVPVRPAVSRPAPARPAPTRPALAHQGLALEGPALVTTIVPLVPFADAPELTVRLPQPARAPTRTATREVARRSAGARRRSLALKALVLASVGCLAGGAWLATHPESVPPRIVVSRTVAHRPALVAAVPHTPPSAYARGRIPLHWLRIYWKVGAEYGLDWTKLAAVGTLESQNGSSTLPGVSAGTNGAHAAGPAQIQGSTWARYGVNVSGNDVSSPYNAIDAVTTMAAYLKASGAPEDWSKALYAYNHSTAYGDAVIDLAARYRG